MSELPTLREPQWAWLARQVYDPNMSAEEAISVIRHHPWVKRALGLAQDVPTGWTAELEAARIKLCEALVTHADIAASFGFESLEADMRDAEQALTILGSLVWPPKGDMGNAWPLYAGDKLIGYVYPDEANAAAFDGATLTVGMLPVKDREPGRPDGWAKVEGGPEWTDHDGSPSAPTDALMTLGTTRKVEVEYSNGHTRTTWGSAIAWKDVKRWRIAR